VISWIVNLLQEEHDPLNHANKHEITLLTVTVRCAHDFFGDGRSSRFRHIYCCNRPQQPTEENVLLNKGTTWTTVFGETNQTHLQVAFSSTTDTLIEPSNGQARIGPVESNPREHEVKRLFPDFLAMHFLSLHVRNLALWAG
jgi:hypothetical protein